MSPSRVTLTLTKKEMEDLLGFCLWHGLLGARPKIAKKCINQILEQISDAVFVLRKSPSRVTARFKPAPKRTHK